MHGGSGDNRSGASGLPWPDDDDFTRAPLGGGSGWWARLWSGGEGRRGLVILLMGWAVLFSLSMALTARAATGQRAIATTPGGEPVSIGRGEAIPRVTLAGQPPLRLATGGWQRIALPASSAAAGAIAPIFTPSPAESATVFACGGQQMNPEHGTDPYGIVFWRTRDTGAHWTSLALPPLSGTWCAVSIAADAPRRVTATALSNRGATGRACSEYVLFLSDDGGEVWRRITHSSIGPVNATYARCLFWATAHHLFFSYNYELGAGPGARQLSMLERSDDEGRTWQRADNGLGGDALFHAWQVGDDDTFVASVATVARMGAEPSHGSELWETRDAGRTWYPILTLADHWTTNLVTAPRPGATVFDTSAPIYALAGEQIPSTAFMLRTRQLRADGARWEALPPLPAPGVNADRMGLTQIVGETADGRLLALGVDPTRGVPPRNAGSDALLAAASAQWVWTWEPRARRWRVMDAPLPGSPLCLGAMCFAHGLSRGVGPDGRGGQAMGTYLWLRGWNSSTPEVYRLFIADEGAS